MVQVGNATAQGLTTPLAGLQLSHSWAFTHLYLASPGILGHLCSKMSAWILGLKSARKQHTEKYATFSRFFCAFFTFFSLNFFAQKWKNEKASEKMKKQLNKIQKTSEKMKNRVKKWNTGEKNECKTSEFSYWIIWIVKLCLEIPPPLAAAACPFQKPRLYWSLLRPSIVWGSVLWPFPALYTYGYHKGTGKLPTFQHPPKDRQSCASWHPRRGPL